MIVTLVLPQNIADDLIVASCHPVETAGVLLARVFHTAHGHMRLLGKAIRWVPDAAYLQRKGDRLSIASKGYVPALAEAETLGAVAVWFHTHPGVASVPVPSPYDRVVDRQLSDVFRLRSGSSHYGSLILSPRGATFSFTGYLDSNGGDTIPITRLWIVGDRFRLIQSFDDGLQDVSPIFDRNVRAFGNSVQKIFHDLRVGIVGCGGTGSAVAEQLVRLGVRRFTLIDPKELAISNVTRVYGSTPSDVGRAKVKVLSEHLLRIAPESQCEPIQSMVTVENTARHLTSCDIVFGCTDDNAGRLVMSRLATYFLTPVIDCGVLLTSNNQDLLMGIDGRVTTLVPGQACLVCRGRIDVARAAAEMLTPEERVQRENEGYAPTLGRAEPAVVTFTTLVAAAAVSELLERLIGYGPEPRPSEVLLRCHDREISTNAAAPCERHYCHPSSGKLGIAMTEPFLEQAWGA